MKELRKYQQETINQCRKSYTEGFKRIMIWLATGGGKSVIFGQLAHNLNKSGKTIIFVVKRRQLIFQAKMHLDEWGLDCGVVMAGEKVEPEKLVQVCSIDTINARIKNGSMDFLSKFDCVIVDECHDCTSPSYKSFFEFIGLEKLYFGLTATPFEVGNKVHDFWETVVKSIEVHELQEMGFLTDAVVYMSHTVDTSDLKATQAGDFKNSEAFDKMKEKRVVGNVVEEYKEKGFYKKALLFAVNIEHSQMMADAFSEAGIPAVHCDQSTKQADRDKAISDLKAGKILVLCNVNIFSTGVDIPEAEVFIGCRPTASEILYIQQIGRILRPYKVCGKCDTRRGAESKCHICGSLELCYEKERAIILDHGENTMRFGLPFEVREAVLTKKDLAKKKGRKPKESEDIKIIRARECKKCFASCSLSAKVCPYCNEAFPVPKGLEIATAEGKLVEVTQEGYIKLQKEQAQKIFNELEATRLQRDFKRYWSEFQLCKRYKGKPMYIQDIIPKWMYKKLVLGELDV